MPTDVSESLLEITLINVSELPVQLDTTRTYEYNFSSVHPESVLLVIWRKGIRFSQAWLPVDYRCKDMIGSRLTVELFEADSRMLDFDFHKGTGRLSCATTLRRYAVLMEYCP